MSSSAGQGKRAWPLRGHIWALLVLVGSLLSVLVLWRAAYERELRAANLEFINSTAEVAELLKQKAVQYELVAGGGASLFASVVRPTPTQWAGYVEGMDIRNRFSAMLGLGFAGYVRQARLGDLQVEWREAGWGLLKVRPVGPRRHYGPILYLEPRTPDNVDAIGFDMFSEPTRRKAMQRALETGRPALSGPVHLIQDLPEKRTGMLLYLPVYRGGARPQTAAGRREGMLGWIYVPFRVDEFVRNALGLRATSAQFRIHDITDGKERLVFDSIERDRTLEPAFVHEVQINQYGRRWRMVFESEPLAQAAPRMAGLRTTLALGVFASLLLYAIAWMLARTELQAQRIALRMTEEFRRSEMRFRTAMENSPIGKALLDSEGAIVESNSAFGKIVGRPPTTLVGARFESLFEDAQAGPEASYAGTGESTDPQGVHRTTRRLHRLGDMPRHAQLTYAPMPGNIGQDIVGLVQVEDVTERLRAQAQVHALNRTLEARVAARTRDLIRANEELETFAYSISHDLRAPLRAIDGFSRILVERHSESLDETSRGYLGRVRKAAARMGELIDALLKMSRLTRGPLKREKVDLSRMAAEVVDDLRATEPDRHVQVRIQPGLEAQGDVVLLRNLLHNLLGNAWKFTRAREDAYIELGSTPIESGCEYHIRDNGAGFAQEYVDKLFRPFQRLHDQEDFPGNGIGLASVKRIVERHGGTIRAQGAEGEGATFYFTLSDEPLP
ncbi:MAG: CHASE domain-containing protein [Pseudomonadota bacterium]|nr:CHASE domain-containing protein [Pseudomonadota bacterium]